MRFVCSFAWTDLKVTPAERDVVRRMIERHGFNAADRARIEAWLEVPPPPEEVDPVEIPREHRQLFLAAAREMVAADGVVESEADTLAVFEELVDS
ncbi:MAG: TerB family tellurite resistance protein [Planctomycetes bacterium]|nr:TerB family tellurite resistance protein [Planctomycetota bacterium]